MVFKTLRHCHSLAPQVRARAQAINANCLAQLSSGHHREQVLCESFQLLYDVIIEDQLNREGNLTEHDLTVAIPKEVLALAVEFDWLSEAVLQAPQVEQAYTNWLRALIKARAEYWRARCHVRSVDIDLMKPELVICAVPATTPEGLYLQAIEVLKAIHKTPPREFSEQSIRASLMAAGVPAERITPARMLKTAFDVANDPTRPVRVALKSTEGRKEGGTLQTPTWEGIEIRFLSDERVQVLVGGDTQTLNYGEMGFVDRRSGKPNQCWGILREMARSEGSLANVAQKGVHWLAIEKQFERTRKALQRHFRLKDDPLPFEKGTGFRARFKISCAACFDK